jgi:hypothetical protein
MKRRRSNGRPENPFRPASFGPASIRFISHLDPLGIPETAGLYLLTNVPPHSIAKSIPCRKIWARRDRFFSRGNDRAQESSRIKFAASSDRTGPASRDATPVRKNVGG